MVFPHEELQRVIADLERGGVPSQMAFGLLGLCEEYRAALDFLKAYDDDVSDADGVATGNGDVRYPQAAHVDAAVAGIRRLLLARGEDAAQFGKTLQGGGADEAFGAVRQSFGGVELYPALDVKAANLFYFIVKNHYYCDGNKRIAAILLLWFLDMNGAAALGSGGRLLPYQTVFALATHVADSEPSEKEAIVKLVAALIRAHAFIEGHPEVRF